MDKKKAMGWFIIIVMVASVFGFIAGYVASDSNNDYSQEYNGFKLRSYNSQWVLSYKDKDYLFQYFPSELENLSLPVDVHGWLSQPRIYLGFQPKDLTSDKTSNDTLVGSENNANKGSYFQTGVVYDHLISSSVDQLDFSYSMQLLEIALSTNNVIPQPACTSERFCPDVPILDCRSNPSIVLLSAVSGQSYFEDDNQCLLIKAADQENLQMMTERVIYELFGVF